MFSAFELALNRKLGLHDPAFLVGHRAFLFLVDDLETSFDLGNEIIGELKPVELLLDLIFQIAHFDILVHALHVAGNIILVTVAVIIGNLFLEVMLGRIATTANGTADKSTQDEIVLVPATGPMIMFLANPLATIMELLVYERRMLPGTDQSTPAHLAVVEMVLKHIREFAKHDALAATSSEAFLVDDVEHGHGRVVAGGVEFEGFLNERSPNRVDNDRSFLFVIFLANIEVADRRMCRPTTLAEFLCHTLGRLTGGKL